MKRWYPYVPFVVAALALFFIVSIQMFVSRGHDTVEAVLGTLGLAAFWTPLLFVAIHLIDKALTKHSGVLDEADEADPENEDVTEAYRREMRIQAGVLDEADEADPENEDVTEAYRREMRIQALKRETAKVRDRILRMGARIGVGLVLFALGMNSMFGFSPKEVYLISLIPLVILWLVQIVFLPKWMTYISFFVFVGLRIGMATFGPQILVYLPNFIMLPFFYLLMMFFMFGSIMLPNLQQVEYFKPGEGGWEVKKGSTRGQFLARAVIDTQIDRFVRYASGESKIKPTRGIIFEGPPGTGKTLYAMEIASSLNLPFAKADASAFNAPFMGFGQLIPLIVKARVEGLSREYGGAVVFIDECETLFGARSGMQQQNQFKRELDLYDVLQASDCQMVDAPHIRTRRWSEEQMRLQMTPERPTEGRHGIFMMPGAGGGNNGAIYPFLTWMSGGRSASLMTRLVRGKINTFLSVFLPVTLFGRILRLPPGKPHVSNVMFIGATNRFFMLDPAMIRPRRFGIVANFVFPDEDERADTAGYYINKHHKLGFYQDDLVTPERIREFARATPNASQAEIEQMIEEAVDLRSQHVAELRRVKRYADNNQLAELAERERKFWLRFKNTVYDASGNEVEGWDDERVNWQALMETRSAISFGRANPEAVNEATRRWVAFHELGHFLGLKSFNGSRITPTLLTVVPRRGSLGMVAHIPNDTREMHMQEYYEGLVRTSIASWVTEHYFFGQNFPGVSGDLKNATNISTLMVGKFGMSPLDCSDVDREYHARIGETLISEPEISMFDPRASALLESVLGNEGQRQNVAVILGMAAIDAYRLIRKNQELFVSIVPEFLSLDEFSGDRLIALWDRLDDELVNLDQLSEEERKVKPINAFSAVNPFYGDSRAEGADIYELVVSMTNKEGES